MTDQCPHGFTDCPVCADSDARAEAEARVAHPTAKGHNIQDTALFNIDTAAETYTNEAATTTALVTTARNDGQCDYCSEAICVGDYLIMDADSRQWIHAIHE